MNIQWPESWKSSLPLPDAEKQQLLQALQEEAPTSVRINTRKATFAGNYEAVPWCDKGRYLPERPRYSSDPAYHAGAFYAQEASSMFLAHILEHAGIDKSPIWALDLCAAPGGKSTLLRDALHPESFLLSNEVVGSRLNLLEEHLCKWGVPGYAICQSDPSRFANLEATFDLIVVDAPCSGEGMFRKNDGAVGQWSKSNVDACATRQARILDAVWPALKPGGLLIYSTCTFNEVENELNLARFAKGKQLDWIELSLPDQGIECIKRFGVIGYRFYPHRVRGEGFYCSVLQKAGTAPGKCPLKGATKQHLRLRDTSFSHPIAVAAEDEKGSIYAVLEAHLPLINALSKMLNLIVPGHPIGQHIRNQFKPLHGMATMAAGELMYPKQALQLEDALRYLSRNDIHLENSHEGPLVLQFDGFNLGFARAQRDRLQSLYPMHWRLREPQAEAYVKIVEALRLP